MSKPKTGGPAFPRPETLYLDGTVSDSGDLGMTLRDWFAGLAMQGALADPSRDQLASDRAAHAYLIADAMLKAREVGHD